MICAYCSYDKLNIDMTDEHVLPRKLGGNLSPQNPFLIKNVCKNCNVASGRYIDGPFIRSWFMQNRRAENAKKYLDLNANPIVPLIYMGEIKNSFIREKNCDMWLGPTGDTIYHFHDPYPEQDGNQKNIGPPLYLRTDDIDPGFAFIFVMATNPAWHKCILFSFVEQFENSILYLGNGPTPEGGRFSEIPAELLDLHKELKSKAGQFHQLQFSINIDFGHRFLAKMALGCGVLFIEPQFIKSVDASKLRSFMWERNPQNRANIQVFGTTFLNEELKPLQQLLGWDAGHIILILPINNKLLLTLILYGEHSATIEICSELNLWKEKINENGIIFVIAPGFRKYVGPISFQEYIAVKTNLISISHPLKDLFNDINSIGSLPPYDLH